MPVSPLGIGSGQSGLRRISDDLPPTVSPAPQPAANHRHHTARDRRLGLLAVLAVASFNLFHRLGEPAQPIWDESYYLTAIARYELREASFASHPPLGLMLLAAGDRLSGANAGVDWRPIAADKKIAGEAVPAGFSFFGVRCASALFGVLAAGLFYLLCVELAGGVVPGLLACSPFLFDTALLAQFRAAQLDAFQLCFAVAALLCLVRSDRCRSLWWPLGFGAACGLAAMVRANGILLLAGAILPVTRVTADRVGLWPCMRKLVRLGAAIFVGTTLTVTAVFLFHVAIACRPMPPTSPAARADARFVGPSYRAFLDARSPLSARVVLEAAEDYRQFLAADVAGIGLHDANGSSPWGWPLGYGVVTYRWDSDGRTTAYVAFAPNRAAWLISLAGLVAGLFAVTGLFCRGRMQSGGRSLLLALLFVWVVLFLSDIVLSRVRVMYIYHYLMPLTLGWLLAATLLGRQQDIVARIVSQIATISVLACFMILSPFALHRPLTKKGCEWREIMISHQVCRK